jgi:hypothetical protein
VLIAAVQHYVCATMKKYIFVPFGICGSLEFRGVADAIGRSSSSHQAIWRLMAVRAILGDQQLSESSKVKLSDLAKFMLASWKPLRGEQEKIQLVDMATDLFVESHTIWLELTRLRDTIHVVDEVKSQYFESDSEDETYSVPGDLKLPNSTAPVLCLFPAFLQTTDSSPGTQSSVIRKGTAMFRDSPPLVLALNEEKDVPSPRPIQRKQMAP